LHYNGAKKYVRGRGVQKLGQSYEELPLWSAVGRQNGAGEGELRNWKWGRKRQMANLRSNNFGKTPSGRSM